MSTDSTVASLVVERAIRSGGNMQVAYSLLPYVRLGRTVMAVVDVRGEVSVQLFPSHMPRYKYVLT